MRLTDELLEHIERGRKGENGVINLPLGRLSDYLEISKGTMYTIGAESSGGKTSFALDQFMIYPLRYYMENKDKMNIKLNIIYFCMERAHVMNTAKLVSKLIYEEEGFIVSVKKIMGRTEQKLTDHEYSAIKRYLPHVEEICSNLKVYEGHRRAGEITKILSDYAAKNGKTVTVKDDDGEDMDIYVPNHPNHITLILIDHIGLISKEKSEIDEFSATMRKSKDFWKFSPVIIQQLNRNIGESSRVGAKNRPKLSDFEGSASTQQDSEVVIAIYNPYTHLTLKEIEAIKSGETVVEDICGYDLSRLRNQFNAPMYRSIHLLKNTYGGAGLWAGVAFQPTTGTFVGLPLPENMTDYDYLDVTEERVFTKRRNTFF